MRSIAVLTWVALCLAGACRAAPATARGKSGVPMVQFTFAVTQFEGNPFDISENDVRAEIRGPSGQAVRVPAFYTGGGNWEVRYAPPQRGRHTVEGVTLNGATVRPEGLSRREFDVAAPAAFVRRDPKDAHRFMLGARTGFYPVGHNAAWSDDGDVGRLLRQMGRAGENWSRIWMDHWDGKNLDWPSGQWLEPGTIDLEAAERWDGIIRDAERAGVRFQMVFQHHGQYSTSTDSNWDENPWNAAFGGFLERPEAFFTDPRAITITRSKYRYILARWGYSGSIMAWELFNEVQWTDAVRNGHKADVAAWHDAMAAFIRKEDVHHHLITSSSEADPAMLGTALDYWQPHAYRKDPVALTAEQDLGRLDRPAFYGEAGPEGSPFAAGRSFAHRLVWASLMREASGAAQYWAWDHVDRKDLYGVFGSAARFAKASRLAGRRNARALRAEASSEGVRVLAKGGPEWAILWAETAADAMPSRTSIVLPGMAPGAYRVSWWDTQSGRVGSSGKAVAGPDGRLTLTAPAAAKDAAAWVER